jgi:glycerophosphoryl diester phosphodiesterase
LRSAECRLLLALACALAAHGCAGAAAHSCILAGRTGMHAHNDYNHTRPLFDALEAGAISVEADVFLQDGVLLVGHDRSQLTAARSLEALYLAPLNALWTERGTLIPAACGGRLWLLVDVKAEPEASRRALLALLARYRPLLGALRVVVSGERDKPGLARAAGELAGYDGRVLEHEDDVSPARMPLVSEQWSRLFSWTGRGAMPAQERARLHSIVAAVHAQGRKLRFWATPDEPGLWRELQHAGVDFINTDSLQALQQYLRAQRP